jgi:hypothetical protein
MWVQKDGVYIGYEKENMIQDSPLDFMKWNTNVIPLQNF